MIIFSLSVVFHGKRYIILSKSRSRSRLLDLDPDLSWYRLLLIPCLIFSLFLYSNIFEQNLRIEVGEGRELQTFRSIFRRKEEMEMEMDGEKEINTEREKDI
jgi:hypothetical protein